MEYLETIGSTPSCEDCVQVGEGNYLPSMRWECRYFKMLLEFAHPAPEGAMLRIKSNPHDFGTYLEVEAHGNGDNEEHWEWVNALCKYETWTALAEAAKAKADPAEWDAALAQAHATRPAEYAQK